MAVSDDYRDFVLEQLAPAGRVTPRAMFGGVGLYLDGLFFALIDDDTLYFKTDDSNVEPYRARRMPRFMPFPDRPEAVLGYHQVPADVIEDAETLVEWARRSVAVALSSRARKSAPKKPKAKENRGLAKGGRPVIRKKAGKRRKLQPRPGQP